MMPIGLEMPPRAILLALQTPRDDEQAVARSLQELRLLVKDLGVAVEATFTQKRPDRKSATYFGEGKLKEIAVLTEGSGTIARGPDEPEDGREDMMIVVDDDITPAQRRNMRSALGVPVLDRVGIILKVFERRAQTHEAKLQVELAKLEYELPRIRDDHSLGDAEGGGGRAARGASNVELAKQRIRQRSAQIRKELANIANSSTRRSEDFQVAIVGYTNAGKSALMRALTKTEIYVEDKLFATLGTTKRKLVPPTAPAIYIADTVGFIERLPHGLIASFRSTLAEAGGAWLMLQVLDVSDPNWRAHDKVSQDVLAEIGLGDSPRWKVFNKIDRLTEAEKQQLATEFPDAILVSALQPELVAALRQKLVEYQASKLEEAELALSYAQYPVLAEMRDDVQIIDEQHGEGVVVKIRSTPVMLAKLRSRLNARQS